MEGGRLGYFVGGGKSSAFCDSLSNGTNCSSLAALIKEIWCKNCNNWKKLGHSLSPLTTKFVKKILKLILTFFLQLSWVNQLLSQLYNTLPSRIYRVQNTCIQLIVIIAGKDTWQLIFLLEFNAPLLLYLIHFIARVFQKKIIKNKMKYCDSCFFNNDN